MSKKSILRDWTVLSKSLLAIAEGGVFPTMKTIRQKLGRTAAECVNGFGGSYEVADKLQLVINRKPKGYWTNKNTLFTHLRNLGSLSTETVIKVLGNGACKAVHKFGGIDAVAKQLGIDKKSKTIPTSDGHFVRSHYEFLVDEYLFSRGIEHQVDKRIPNSNFRYDFKIGDVFIEIWGYEKNSHSTRIRREYNAKRIIKEHFYTTNNLKLISIEGKLFKQTIEEIIGELDSLFSACGFSVKEVRQINLSVPNISTIEKNAVNLFNKVVDEIGYFPSSSELYSLGRYDLIYVIKRLGGYARFVERFFNKPGFKKYNGYWTDERIKTELAEVIKDTESKLTQKNIISMGRHDLVSAMGCRGGMNKYLKELKYARN